MERLIKILSRFEEKVINLQLPFIHRYTWLAKLVRVDDRCNRCGRCGRRVVEILGLRPPFNAQNYCVLYGSGVRVVEIFWKLKFLYALRANILYIMEISLIVMIILGLHYLGNRVAKILPLGKTQIYLVFLSLNRTFGLMPLGTPARKNSNLFGFSLT